MHPDPNTHGDFASVDPNAYIGDITHAVQPVANAYQDTQPDRACRQCLSSSHVTSGDPNCLALSPSHRHVYTEVNGRRLSFHYTNPQTPAQERLRQLQSLLDGTDGRVVMGVVEAQAEK